MFWLGFAIFYYALWLAIQVRGARARFCKPRDITAST